MAQNSNDKIVQRFNLAQTQLVIQTADLPLGTLADMVTTGAIDLEPAFQRRERWDIYQQSALIESFLLNVPVPPIYLAEEADGTYTAIDGKQRLRAIANFMADMFPLTQLERMGEANGYKFSDFPDVIRNPLRLRPFIRVVTLLKQSDSALKYEVFLRLNRGGESLNAQEIRNVAFRGPLNDLVYELSRCDFLRSQLKIFNDKSAAYRNMQDAELVLRFLTLHDRMGRFSGSLIREMDDFLRRRRNDTAATVEGFRTLFLSSIERCERIWDQSAFKRPAGENWREQLLAGMYDAQMLAVSQLSEEETGPLIRNSNEVIAATRALFSDRTFEDAVRSGTNTPQRIDYRVSKVLNMLREIANERR